MSYTSFKEKQKSVFKRSNQLREKATESELIFKKRLEENGIYFMFQKGFINGTHYYIVDFYLPKPLRTVVEIDGGYHNDPVQVWKDEIRDRYLTEQRGFNVIRIKNEDVNTFDISIFTN